MKPQKRLIDLKFFSSKRGGEKRGGRGGKGRTINIAAAAAGRLFFYLTAEAQIAEGNCLFAGERRRRKSSDKHRKEG
jgi:hypothetical protein